MEQQNVQVEEGVSLMDIIRLLLSKIKLLILVVLIGGIVGGAFAYWKSKDINYWGTKVEFYINPEKPKDSVTGDGSQYGVYGAYGAHVMDNMVKLLNSDSFAEEMLLDADGLPRMAEKQKDANGNTKDVAIVWATEEEETKYAFDFDKLMEDAKDALKELQKDNSDLNILLEEKVALNNEYNVAYKELNAEWQNAYLAKVVTKSTFDLLEYRNEIHDKNIYPLIQQKYEAIYGDNESSINSKLAVKDQQIETLTKTRDAKNDDPTKGGSAQKAEYYRNQLLSAWRKTAKYASELVRYGSAINFSYLKANESLEDAQNFARSFIYASVSVLGNENRYFAEQVYDRIMEVVPRYVEAKMIVPNDYSGTNCEPVTRLDSVHLTNPGYTRNQIIKLGFLLGFASLVVACVVIIWLDKSDKRIRDTEIITTKFNVPLLGVIPSIEEMNLAQKKSNRNTTEVK